MDEWKRYYKLEDQLQIIFSFITVVYPPGSLFKLSLSLYFSPSFVSESPLAYSGLSAYSSPPFVG